MFVMPATRTCKDATFAALPEAQSHSRGPTMIAVIVRLNGQLATTVGTSRLQLSLPDDADISHVVTSLAGQFPAASQLLERAIPVIDGRHATPGSPLSGVAEVALLMPIAGG